jgi:dihydroflavonol-4-reductase
MTLALVTGANGFIGAHVVRALLSEGVAVRAMVRAGSDGRNLDGLEVERVEGDLRDGASLRRAVAGADVVFHVAAVYELGMRRRTEVLRANVDGTRLLMEAALAAGVERVVHTSSVAAVGHVRDDGSLADESDWTASGAYAGPYEESKVLSERLVHELVEREGLPAVVVNPTAPIGPLDVKPTPTGRMIVEGANGSMPGYIRSAGLNVVHVEDVARGHVLAWQRGRVGERYILGHREGNLSLREVLSRAAAVTGRRAPRWAVPYGVALGYAYFDEWALSPLLRRTARAPVAGVRLSRRPMWFDCRKAVEELGMPQTPVEEAFASAVAWFRGEGRVG